MDTRSSSQSAQLGGRYGSVMPRCAAWAVMPGSLRRFHQDTSSQAVGDGQRVSEQVPDLAVGPRIHRVVDDLRGREERAPRQLVNAVEEELNHEMERKTARMLSRALMSTPRPNRVRRTRWRPLRRSSIRPSETGADRIWKRAVEIISAVSMPSRVIIRA